MDDQPPLPPPHSFQSFGLDLGQSDAILALSKLDDLEDRLKKVMAHDWAEKSPEIIWKVLSRYLKYLPLQATLALPHDIDQIKVYRCRLNIDEDNERLDLWSTYSTPPPHFCIANGRANVRGFPVFYCSDHPTSAIAEMRPKRGDIIYHTEWLIRSFRATSRTIIFDKNIPEANPWREIALNKISVEYNGYLQIVGKEKAQKVSQLLSFLAELFVTEAPPYPVSSAIAHKMIFGQLGIDYILYPSFQTNSAASNMAFHPNFAASNMILNKILVLEVDEAKQEGVIVKHCKTGLAFHNQILWRPPQPEELNFVEGNQIS